MSIYRGAGGAGDAVNDASSEAILVQQLVVEAQADADAASASATAAAGSASTASTAATNASNSATAAATSATNANNSASSASTSATNAANSATAAQTAETAAELAETNAETAQAAAASSASAASSSATTASTAATNASNSASAASTSATNASNSASAASTSASNASTSATAAAGSASSASTSASNASTSATSAASSATSASTSATTATTQAGIATTKAGEAATSATNAATSATTATTQAGIATTQATNASNSASAAATSATNAANSATSASTSATNAANSATAAAASAASINLSSIAITGGSINGTTIGATTPSTGSFTSLTDSGNLTFTGTGNRIRGDFSNATLANRVAFQTSTTNGNTIVSLIPNGTATIAQLQAFGGSDVDNTSQVQFANVTNNAVISANRTGTGTFGNILFNTGGSERLRIDTSGNVGIGTSSPVSRLDVTGITRLSSTAFVAPSGGKGLELWYQSDTDKGYVGSFDRATSVYKPLQAFASVIDFNISGTEAMRIIAGGNVGIGTSSPNSTLEVNGEIRITRPSVNTQYLKVYANVSGTFIEGVSASGNAKPLSIQTDTNSTLLNLTTVAAQPIIFNTTNTERMRITSGGYLKASNNGSYVGVSDEGHELRGTTGSNTLRVNSNNTSFTSVVTSLECTRNTSNNTYYFIQATRVGSADVFRVADSGNVTNTNNSYGAISDVKLKENIVDATPKLEDLCKVKVRQYNLKSEPDHKQIGVVAQELEEVFAGLVETIADKDADGNDLGTTTKQVKYSVFVPMLIKAMQEQQAMIENLTTRLNALEGK